MAQFKRVLPILLVGLTLPGSLDGYSVLSHEAVIDALWDVKLRAILLARYPAATEEDLKRAHGYAYGGAIIQDLGYYPHGGIQFSDLTHYVRTGDFVAALLREAHDLNELAFALGALSHYVADPDGHRLGTNVAEPILYPRLRRKFGSPITYEDNPAGHIKTEFGFDVLEVARGNFAPQAYHDFIGFYVSKELLARAIRGTYGLELTDLFSSFDLAISSYRSTVSRLIPSATRIAWAAKSDEIQRAQPGMTHQRFIYIMKRSSYEREWGKRLQEPNLLEKFLAILLKIVPPIGPLGILQLKVPTPAVEQIFMASFDRTVAQYGPQLDSAAKKSLDLQRDLQDKNYDVGVITPAGVYRLTDDTEAFWLHKLAGKGFATLTPEMKQELLEFYKDLNAPFDTKRKPKEWRQTLAELAELKGQATTVTNATVPGSGGSFYHSSQEPCRPLSLVR